MDITISNVIIEEGADNYKQTEVILRKLENVPIKRVEKNYPNKKDISVNMDKETLRLIDFKGEFFKPCPGTKGYICCGYHILNTGTNCPFNCSYCILQVYFNQPSLRVFVNLEHELDTVGHFLDLNHKKLFRIGTGEFTDSLALDHVTDWSKTLTRFVNAHKNVVLELKTKTDNINGLFSSSYRERIVVSWSMNSIAISAKEEHGATSIIKRLKAAKRCQEEGYIISFHFDPLIYFKDWKNGYLKTIELIDKYINLKKVIWISMGCIRYIPALKFIIRKRHHDTHILDGEFITGLDGKMRYFKPIRIEMYSFMKEFLDKLENNLGLYLCMESPEIWLKSFGWSPENSNGLSDYLNKRVNKLYKTNY